MDNVLKQLRDFLGHTRGQSTAEFAAMIITIAVATMVAYGALAIW